MQTKHQAVFNHRLFPTPLADFDLGGVLYHANYFRLFEQAREALLRTSGLPYSSLVSRGFHLAIVEANVLYHAPVRYGDDLSIQLWCSQLGAASARLHYKLSSLSSCLLLTEAQTRHSFVELQPNGTFKPRRFIPELRAILANHSLES